MADSKLTDLPEVTTIADNDVLYLANVTLNQSNKITYANLINTKFVALNTEFEAVSASVDTLNSQFPNIRNEVLAQTAREGFFTMGGAVLNNTNFSSSAVFVSTFSFVPYGPNGTDVAANVLSATLPSQFSPGDILTPSYLGTATHPHLSGVELAAVPLSGNALTLIVKNNTGNLLQLSGGGLGVDDDTLYFKVDYQRST
tara:strand:+ start:531 stop:1130 length:600 start_codon:yes stop_codon:yes gene_type:complete